MQISASRWSVPYGLLYLNKPLYETLRNLSSGFSSNETWISYENQPEKYGTSALFKPPFKLPTSQPQPDLCLD
jgi:hypothetical protein